MPASILKRSYSTARLEFENLDFSGLLDIYSSPIFIPDNCLSIAENVYGTARGGVSPRFGVKRIGSPVVASQVKGICRFYQTVIDGVAQNPARVQTITQKAGAIYNANGDVALTPLNTIGTAALPWSIQRVYDGQHLQSPPTMPLVTVGRGAPGTLADGTYTYAVTVTTGAGETLPSFQVTGTIVGGGGQGKVQLNWTLPPGTLTSVKVYGRVGGSLGLLSDGTLAASATTYTDIGTGTVGAAPPGSNTAGVAASDVLIICTGSGGPYIWDGYTVYTPSDYSNNVSGARWVKLVNSVIWFGNYPSNPAQVTGGLIGNPETIPGFLIFTMKQSVTGLGIVTYEGISALAVGMQKGLTLIYGDYPGNVQTQDVDDPDGVIAGRTMITVNGVLYYLGSSAFYKYDGLNPPMSLSRNIEPWILNDPRFNNTWDIPMSGDKSLAWSFFFNNKIYVFYDSGNVGYPNVGVVWDVLLSGWTSYMGKPLCCGTTLDAPGDASNPWAAQVGDSVNGRVYNFEVSNGTGDDIDDDGTAFTTFALSKYFHAGPAGHLKTVRRIYPELFVETFGGTLVLYTDYSPGGGTGVPIIGQAGGAATWDSSLWDQSTWAAGVLQHVEQRCDFNVRCLAFAVGILTNDTNPPYFFNGFSVEYVLLPRR